MRNFVHSHPGQLSRVVMTASPTEGRQQDGKVDSFATRSTSSAVSIAAANELISRCEDIGMGRLQCPELVGDVYIQPLTADPVIADFLPSILLLQTSTILPSRKDGSPRNDRNINDVSKLAKAANADGMNATYGLPIYPSYLSTSRMRSDVRNGSGDNDTDWLQLQLIKSTNDSVCRPASTSANSIPATFINEYYVISRSSEWAPSLSTCSPTAATGVGVGRGNDQWIDEITKLHLDAELSNCCTG